MSDLSLWNQKVMRKQTGVRGAIPTIQGAQEAVVTKVTTAALSFDGGPAQFIDVVYVSINTLGGQVNFGPVAYEPVVGWSPTVGDPCLVQAVGNGTGRLYVVSFPTAAPQTLPGYFDVTQYGADPTGTHDSTDAFLAAHDAAVDAGGGTVFMPPGTYLTNNPDGFVWTSGLASLTGANAAACTLRAGPGCTAAPLEVNFGSDTTVKGAFSDFSVDAHGYANNAIWQFLSTEPDVYTETSVGTVFTNVIAFGAEGSVAGSPDGHQWKNQGCEDCFYINCLTPADEGSPSSVPRSFYWDIPGGACTIIGGELFGKHFLNCQALTFIGAVAGPFSSGITGGAGLITLIGGYYYDGGIDKQSVFAVEPVSDVVPDGGALFNIEAIGVYLVMQSSGEDSQNAFVNGNIPIGVNVVLRNCVYTQGNDNTSSTVNLVSASGDGNVWIEGGQTAMVAANPQTGGTINVFNPVDITPGAWSDTTAYFWRDTVTYEGTAYRNTSVPATPVGTLPTDTSYWESVGTPPIAPGITFSMPTYVNGVTSQYEASIRTFLNILDDGTGNASFSAALQALTVAATLSSGGPSATFADGIEVTTKSGGGAGDALALKDQGTGDTKAIRLDGSGNLQILNDAFSAVILELDDEGFLQLPGGISPGNFGSIVNSNALWMGSGAPSGSDGSDGDGYWRTDGTSPCLYKKVSGSWTVIV